MKVINIIQGTDEWKRARLGIATASNFDAVQAKGKGGEEAATRRNYRIKLALQRVTGVIEEGFTSQAMLNGVEREPIARSIYEMRTNEIVDEVGLVLHDTLECGASPDGLVGSNGLIEIKCPTQGVHLEYLRLDREPAAYTAQIQGQLWVTEREWTDFVSFNPDFPDNCQLIVRRIHRDDEYIKRLADAVAAFMDDVRSTEDYVRNYKEAA